MRLCPLPDGSAWRWRRLTPRGRGAQGTVEFAMVISLFLLLLLPAMQLGFIAIQQYSVMRVTRETTRWLAVHWSDTTDANSLHHARGEDFVNANGTPVISTSGNPLSLRPSLLTLSISPPCPSLVTPVPPSTDPPSCSQRQQSGAISVTATYDIASSGAIFFGPRIMGVGIPTGARTYTAAMVME